jgi:serine/threonine protein phosphatase PrpC
MLALKPIVSRVAVFIEGDGVFSQAGVRTDHLTYLHSSIQCPATGEGQDRVCVLEVGTQLVIAVADGAGGTGSGDTAADMAVSLATTFPGNIRQSADPRYWATRLAEIDSALANDPRGGQAALVVASVFQGEVVGAAVGDAVAWLIDSEGTRDLTAGTRRKPLLGDGGAIPFVFGPIPLGTGTLLLATDGLWKYATRSNIAECAAAASLSAPCAELVDLVRLRSGALQDDVAAVLVRTFK